MIKKQVSNKTKKVDTIKQLKERWKQLRQYIKDDIENNQIYYNQTGEMVYRTWEEAEKYILDKMEDLEG